MSFYLRYLPEYFWRLIALQLLILVRPLLGSFGFMLVVPLLGYIGLAEETSAGALKTAVDMLPDFQTLEDVLWVMFCTLTLIAVANFGQALFRENFEQDLLLRLRTDLCRYTLNADWQFLAKIHGADFTRMVTEDVDTITDALDEIFSLASQLFLIGVYVVLSLLLSAQLTFLAVATGLTLLIVSYPLQRMTRDSGERQFHAQESLHRKSTEQIKGIKSIKSSRTEALQLSAISEISAQLSAAARQFTQASALSAFFHSLTGAAAFCLLALVASRAVPTDTTLLILLALIFSRLLPQVTNLQSHARRLSYLYPELSTITRFFQQTSDNQEAQDPGDAIDFSHGVAVTGLDFHYDDERATTIYYDDMILSFGSVVAIRGPSGIGKTTLADLLAGIMVPITGSISAGAVKLDNTNQRAWRRQVTYLPQEPFLIAGTIRENLQLLNETQLPDAALWPALNLAGAGFVHALPEQLDTQLAADGLTLSGGERQRLILARALLMDRQVIIMDESTNQLDLANEAAFLNTLQELKENHLIVIISHRTTISQIADQIVEVHETH